MALHPLLSRQNLDDPWIISRRGHITAGHFLYRVYDLGEALPEHRYCILICEDRANFIVAFAAALLRGQTVLLPSDRTRTAITELAESYPNAYCLTDKDAAVGQTPILNYRFSGDRDGFADRVPSISSGHLAAIAFTSGSTGKPEPSHKLWGDLVKGTEMARERFGFDAGQYLVATVPPQHMYGLETSVLVPLLSGTRIWGGKPLFPEDIRQALAAAGGERTLVTTPFHLRACLEARLDWPALHRIISATAPLDASVATRAEESFRAPVHEIFGSTETGSIASRRTLRDDGWTMYEGGNIKFRDGKTHVIAPHLPGETVLGDVIETDDERHFRVLGRATDMVKIGGNRASLADLNHKLNSIPGVCDGAFIQPQQDEDAISRLVAVVVAPDMKEEDILHALAERMDRIFLPRPVYLVDRLPRVETGKLPRKALMAFLRTLDRRNEFSRDYCVAGEHPGIADHFPGHPVVPGAVILELVRDCLAQWRPQVRVHAIVSARFLAPLAPEQTFRIQLTPKRGLVGFQCIADGAVFARGELKLDGTSDS
jgi:acyl-coenzyme A synthetase/AMP-(fatty) acid ligase